MRSATQTPVQFSVGEEEKEELVVLSGGLTAVKVPLTGVKVPLTEVKVPPTGVKVPLTEVK